MSVRIQALYSSKQGEQVLLTVGPSLRQYRGVDEFYTFRYFTGSEGQEVIEKYTPFVGKCEDALARFRLTCGVLEKEGWI